MKLEISVASNVSLGFGISGNCDAYASVQVQGNIDLHTDIARDKAKHEIAELNPLVDHFFDEGPVREGTLVYWAGPDEDPFPTTYRNLREAIGAVLDHFSVTQPQDWADLYEGNLLVLRIYSPYVHAPDPQPFAVEVWGGDTPARAACLMGADDGRIVRLTLKTFHTEIAIRYGVLVIGAWNTKGGYQPWRWECFRNE